MRACVRARVGGRVCARACVRVRECFHTSVEAHRYVCQYVSGEGRVRVFLYRTILAPRVRACMYGLPYLETRVQA